MAPPTPKRGSKNTSKTTNVVRRSPRRNPINVNVVPQVYPPRTFMVNPENKLDVETFTSEQVNSWNNRYDEVPPAQMPRDPTKYEKEECIEEVKKYIETVKAECRKVVTKMLISIANDVVKMEREDGQPITTWSDALRIMKKNANTEHDEKAYDLIYGKVPFGYEYEKEQVVMKTKSITYRQLLGRHRKGFVAKLCSLVMNERERMLTG